jgi:hypothetical protein
VQGASGSRLVLPKVNASSAGVYSVDVFDGETWVRSVNALLFVPPVVRFVGASPLQVAFAGLEAPLTADDLPAYRVQWSSDLVHWHDVQGPLALAGDVATAQVASDSAPAKAFYRVTVE